MTTIDRETSRLLDVSLPNVYGLASEAAANRANQEALDRFKASLDAESVFSRRGFAATFLAGGLETGVVGWFGRQGWEPDPNFELTQDAYEKLAEGIDPDLWPRLATAVSFEHSVFLREQAKRQTENRRLLSAYGWGGQALYTAGQFISPTALATGIASAGIATAVSAGTSASRVARLARAGFIGASGNAAVTAISGVDDPRIGPGDIALSAAAGAGFGVGVGATRLRGVVGRAVGAGVGQAAPGFAVDLAGTATGDRGVSDLLLNAAHNLASGGVLGGLNFNTPRLSEAVTPEAVARVAKGNRQAGTELAFTLQEDMRNTASRMAKDALWEDLRNTGITPDDLTPDGLDYFEDQVNPRVYSPVIGLLDSMPPGDAPPPSPADAPPPSDAPRTEVPPRTNDVGLGAANANAPGMGGGPPPKTNAQPGDLDLSGVNDAAWAMNARTTFGGRDVNIEGAPTRTRDESRVFGLPRQFSTRFSMGSWVGGHVLPQFRRLANALFPDPLAKSDGSIVRMTAAEWATTQRRRSDNRASAALTEAYARHIEARAAAGSKPLTLDEFFDVADRAHRDPSHQMRSDPGVSHAIAEATAFYKDHLDLMQRHGVYGADAVPFDADYTPVRWSRAALDSAVRKYGDTAVVNALAKAILADPKQRADPAMAWHLAGAIVKNGGVRGFDRSGAWTPEEVESVRSAVQSWIESSQPGLNPKQVQDLTEMVVAYASEQSAPAETGKPPRLRRRIPMDHAAVIDMPDGSRLPVSDLLINDIELQMRGYANQAVGASAIAEVFRTQGSGKATNIRDFVAELRQTAIDYSLKPQEYQSSLEHIETGLKLVAGLPLYDTHTATARSLRVIRDLNAARTLGSLAVGVQNFAELGQAIGRNGLYAAARTFFPALEAVRKEAIRRNTGVARELALVGSVDDAFGGRWRGFSESAADRAMGKGKGERLAHAVADGSMRMNLLKQGQSFMQRWSTLMLMQRLSDMAVSSRPMSGQWLARLGWSDTEAAAILDQLRTHQRREGSTFDPNVDAWTDTAAQAAYREGVAWAVRRDILNPSAIDGPRWMTTPVGQIFGQLRRFSIGAWESKLLYGIQRRDKLVFAEFMGATVAAALTYMARRMVDAATKEDPGAYLEEQLAPDKIAAAAFSRSAYASLLPGFADSLLNLTGRPAVFEFARGSGLKGNFWEGVPTIDWLSNVWRARQTIPGVTLNPDYHFSEEDLRAMTNAAFIPNVLGIRDILYRLAREAGLPSRSISGN